MLPLVIFTVLIVALLLLIVLDIARKIQLTGTLPSLVVLAYLLNLPAFNTLYPGVRYNAGYDAFMSWPLRMVLVLATVYCFVRYLLFPYRDGKIAGLRLKTMMGGSVLTRVATIALFWQALLLWFLYLWLRAPTGELGSQSTGLMILNGIYALVAVAALFLMAGWRMMLTSRRLSIVWRVLLFLLWWVPIVNLVVLHKCARLCREEYDFALYKQTIHQQRVESDICQTRYPLVMVHGVLFRDLRWFNYWGRIPAELVRYGATVYYGNQEAVGTIARNGADLRAKCLEIIEETGCEKVNIIAHSKGGLDARYAVTCLGLAPYVASVTTIATPHHGVKFVDKACNLPEGLYRFIAKIFDNTFRRMGDSEPDFYTATRQFATAASTQFNQEVPDVPGVYYQSYTNKMRWATSDSLLCVPYLLVKATGGGDNDGLVTVESAKWGEFRGVLTAPGRRGISHGDIIDLKREDIKGFDVCETYVGIVKDLKEKGY